MVNFPIDRNAALLVRAVLFLLGTAGTFSHAIAQAPIIDTSQPSSAYGQSQPASSGTNYDVTAELRQLQQEVMQLRGMVEEQAFQIQQLQQRQPNSAPANNAAAISQPQDMPANDPAAENNAAAPSEAAPQNEPVAADASGDEDAYRAAYNLIKAQKFDQAAAAFQEFVKTYPGSRYEPNAYYWLGELNLQTQDLDASFEAYSILVDKYPDNSKVADARYKLAKVYFLKGEKTKSRDSLKQVIASYPSTSTAQAAQKFLKENF
jgi:tol-pal system protein YbgF